MGSLHQVAAEGVGRDQLSFQAIGELGSTWQGGVVPNAPDADVTIPGGDVGLTTAGYTVQTLSLSLGEFDLAAPLSVSGAAAIRGDRLSLARGGSLDRRRGRRCPAPARWTGR